MLMKRLLLCLWMLAGLLWLQSNPVAAQEKKFQIKGRVTNSAQEPLEGVSAVSYTHLTLPTNREV